MHETDIAENNFIPLALLESDIGNSIINEKIMSKAFFPVSLLSDLFKLSFVEYFRIWSGMACFKYDRTTKRLRKR